MKFSIILRAKNEEENLKKLFSILKSQTEQDFEIIFIDNESTDNSLSLAKECGAKILSIPQKEFSYPKASNMGASIAQGELLVFLSAHSFLPTETWLSDSFCHFSDQKVCGAYGETFFYEDSPLLERAVWFFNWLKWELRFFIKPRVITKAQMGVLGMTNAIIRKSLWEEYHFNEAYAAGGEDGEWAKHFLNRGYKIILDPKLSVRHTHRIKTIANMKKQFAEWKKTTTPQPFSITKRDFRGD